MLARLALVAVLLVAAALRLWRLDQNGFGNEYYSAGVRSMSRSWHNFLYHAFDPAGFISVDKPPLAAWIQVASVKLLGFHGLGVLLPQVLEGVAAVWLVHHLVQRRFGRAAGLLAALFLAVTPVSVAVDRSSNTESCLVLVLLLAAWALLRAAESGSRAWLLLSMALVGVGFNVKMLAAFVVLPAFALVYALGAKLPWRRRLVDATLAALVLVGVAASWIAVYDLTRPAARPYAGTTDSNTIRELAIGPYGVGRFVRQVRPAAVAAEADGASETTVTARRRTSATERAPDTGPRVGRARVFVRAPAGPLRLADGQLAGQVGWLLPLALAGVVLGVGREAIRRPLAPARLTLLLWLTWALTYALAYSAAGGIFHYYYMVMLAPPLAALAGVGVAAMGRQIAEGRGLAVLLPAAVLAVTAAWQLYVDAHALGGLRDLDDDLAALRTLSGGWRTWLRLGLAAGALIGVGGLLVAGLRAVRGPSARAVALGALGLGILATLVLPAAWALSSVLVAGPGVLPAADVARLLPEYGDRARRPVDTEGLARLVAFLNANRRGERYLVATSTVMLAAPLIIETGEPVMARGGFHGLDPILTPGKLARMVEASEVRFAMLGDLSLVSRRMGAETAGQPIADWVRANGKLVDPAAWRTTRRSAMALYDLRPDLGLAPSPSGR